MATVDILRDNLIDKLLATSNEEIFDSFKSIG